MLGETNSKSFFANRALAKIKCSHHDLRSAADDCGAAPQIDPTYSEAYVRRGTLLDQLSQYNAAVKNFNASDKLDVDGGLQLQSFGSEINTEAIRTT